MTNNKCIHCKQKLTFKKFANTTLIYQCDKCKFLYGSTVKINNDAFYWLLLVLLIVLVFVGMYYWLYVAVPACMNVFNNYLYCLVRG
jgi:hypothetical protein